VVVSSGHTWKVRVLGIELVDCDVATRSDMKTKAIEEGPIE
jgi:hypothetical protein